MHSLHVGKKYFEINRSLCVVHTCFVRQQTWASMLINFLHICDRLQNPVVVCIYKDNKQLKCSHHIYFVELQIPLQLGSDHGEQRQFVNTMIKGFQCRPDRTILIKT